MTACEQENRKNTDRTHRADFSNTAPAMLRAARKAQRRAIETTGFSHLERR